MRILLLIIGLIVIYKLRGYGEDDCTDTLEADREDWYLGFWE